MWVCRCAYHENSPTGRLDKYSQSLALLPDDTAGRFQILIRLPFRQRRCISGPFHSGRGTLSLEDHLRVQPGRSSSREVFQSSPSHNNGPAQDRHVSAISSFEVLRCGQSTSTIMPPLPSLPPFRRPWLRSCRNITAIRPVFMLWVVLVMKP